jgi:hypothetical protein
MNVLKEYKGNKYLMDTREQFLCLYNKDKLLLMSTVANLYY